MIERDAVRRALGPLPMPAEEIREFVAAVGQPPPPAVRLRRGLDPAELPFPVRPIAWSSTGFFLSDRGRPSADVRYACGDYYIQDAGSLLAVTLLNAQPHERICDLCAAPGGKATAALEEMDAGGWLLANEPVRARHGALQFNLARHGGTRFAVSCLDPHLLSGIVGPVFDAVLVDAPCSGQSLLGRGKQTDSAYRPRTIEFCAARQARILAAAAGLVRPQGRLVYSTCTFSFAENEGQVEHFLQRHPAWKLERAERLEAFASSRLPGCYRLWPHRDGCGGAFAALLRRSDDVDGAPAGAPRVARPARLVPAALPREFGAWGELRSAHVWGSGRRCFAWPEPLWPPLLAVAEAGPEAACREGSTWFPAYALAMRRDPQWTPAARVALDERQASKYLRGESLSSSLRGWCVATWNERPLGWMKGDGSRLKNHLPKPGRLDTQRKGPCG